MQSKICLQLLSLYNIGYFTHYIYYIGKNTQSLIYITISPLQFTVLPNLSPCVYSVEHDYHLFLDIIQRNIQMKSFICVPHTKKQKMFSVT